MIHHYFKIALRNLSRQKILSFINISGLSIGLACFSLFLLYSVNEFSFDRFHKNAENIYRVYSWYEAQDGRDAYGDGYLPAPLAPVLKAEFPDVVDYVRLRDARGESFIKTNDKVLQANISYVDPSFFSVFTFPLLYGSPQNALKDLQNIVVTRSKAKELFGTENAVGQTVQIEVYDNFIPFTVTAVADDIPSNSSIHFELLGNFKYMESTNSGKGFAGLDSKDKGEYWWDRHSYINYVQLNAGSSLAYDKHRLERFNEKYQKNMRSIALQPLKTIHTNPEIFGSPVGSINPKTIWILLSIAAGILLIACINFTTLAIGRSARRAKEVGVRKIIGGERKQLIIQFLSEAVLLSLLSAILGLFLANFLLPFFNQLSGRELRFSFSLYPEMKWMIAGLILIVGLLAGSYPALVLSGFKPLEVLKSKIKISGSNLFTKSLVTGQFALSIGLIISTSVILQQTKYMSSKDPGFNKENIVVVKASGSNSGEIYPLFKQALASRSDVINITNAELGLGEDENTQTSGFDFNGTHHTIFEYFVDADYIPVMGMQLIAGRNFDPKISDDTLTSIIINESMARDFGWTNENAVGQRMDHYVDSRKPVVIGLVKDFHFTSLKEKIEPQLFHRFADQFDGHHPNRFFVRLKPGSPASALAAMQKTWNSLVTDLPFQYGFLDEKLDNFYKAERKWSNIIGWAGGISLFLACLGLFGLAALTAVNRTKEIGIRKVLGASLPVIVKLLSKDFLKLVVLALIVAAPLAWYFMNKWLQDFAYRISIGWWVFIVAGSLAIVVAFVTIGFQAMKAGIANPVKSLRTE